MGVDPITDTTNGVRISSWTCSYTLRVKQPVADRIIRKSFRPVPTRAGRKETTRGALFLFLFSSVLRADCLF